MDCLWIIGEPIYGFKQAVERWKWAYLQRWTPYDWITFLRMSDGSGAYNRYTGIYVPLPNKIEIGGICLTPFFLITAFYIHCQLVGSIIQ